MIKAIIFDWGGVLTKGKHTDSIIRLLEKKFNTPIRNHKPSFGSFMDMMDFQGLGFEEFVNRVNKEFNLKVTVGGMEAIFSKAIILNTEVIDFVKRLRAKYRVVILSNNNELTIRLLRTEHKELLDLFEKAYFSCEVGEYKPDKGFFEYALRNLSIKAVECLFIDDKQKSIEAAEKLGMKSILFKSNPQLEKQLQRFGVL